MWRNRWHRRSSQCRGEHPARYMLENFYGCSSLSLGGLRLWRWFLLYRSLNIHSRNPKSMSHKDCWQESRKKKFKNSQCFPFGKPHFDFSQAIHLHFTTLLDFRHRISRLLNSHLIPATPPPPPRPLQASGLEIIRNNFSIRSGWGKGLAAGRGFGL